MGTDYRTVYRSCRNKGQSFAPRFTVVHRLEHSVGSTEQLRVTACSFCVNDDSTIVTQTTFSTPANVTRAFKAGFVQIWNLMDISAGHDDSLFTYSPVAEFSLSPNGDIIASILNSGLGVLYLVEKITDHYASLEPCKFECLSKVGSENMNGRPCCCVFSPDGRLAVTISVVSTNLAFGRRHHELCLWRVGPSKVLTKALKIICEHHLSCFSGQPHNCIFACDGSLIAISTELGQLYVLKTYNLEVYAVIKHVVQRDNVCMCSFNPDTCNAKLSICFSDGLFQLWTLQPYCALEMKIVTSPSKISTMKHSQDYCLIAFGTTTGQVLMYDTVYYHHLYTINCRETIQDASLEVCSVSFSKSCHELAVGYNDGCARIWQLPVKMDLQHLCRMEILQIVPENMICKLPLPESLKAYLMFKSTFNIQDK